MKNTKNLFDVSDETLFDEVNKVLKENIKFNDDYEYNIELIKQLKIRMNNYKNLYLNQKSNNLSIYSR